ncbi:MAG: 50S ribosomal protein L24e [Candidatus Nitrosoabyssus spongiisocia]|nr:MAG: 50S ribosomal protein L24e [Nitrosopumilaceae archaeon AB1(1)]
MSLLVKSCSFCNRPVTKGSGIMFAKNDGTLLWFCSAKCKKNSLELKRDPRKLKWTLKYVKGGIRTRK